MKEKTVKKTQSKCSSCGGNLKFSPEDKALKCVFCNSCEKIEYDKNVQKHDFNAMVENTQAYAVFAQENKTFQCSNCGAKILLNKLEISKNCPYCSSPCVMKKSEVSGLAPDAIIPFKFSGEQAAVMYKKALKKKWFLPNKFKKSPPVDNIKGVYVPCFSFDANSSTSYRGVLSKTTSYTSNGKTRTKTTYQNISGDKNMTHKDVLIETSSHIDQVVFNSIKPFNTNELVVFKSSFLMGYSVEHYNQSLNNCKQIADNIMKQDIKNAILSQYSYTNVESFSQTTNFSNQKYSYYILPTYQVSYEYKQKNYVTYMNGQTGTVGSGLPRSAVKITFFVLFIIAIILGIIALVNFLG